MKRLLLCATLLVAALPLLAQEMAIKPPSPARHFYKLTYVLKEFDEGKVVNQRDFVVTVSTGERYSSRLRAGSRFPIRDEGKTNYVDVGLNLDNHLEDVPDGLAMDVNAEISSASNDPATSGGGAHVCGSAATDCVGSTAAAESETRGGVTGATR